MGFDGTAGRIDDLRLEASDVSGSDIPCSLPAKEKAIRNKPIPYAMTDRIIILPMQRFYGGRAGKSSKRDKETMMTIT